MENEYGEKLDSNGYAPSILHSGDCMYCRSPEIIRHEIFRGPNRQKSKRYGLWVNLCPVCHQMIHQNARLSRLMMENAQTKAMKEYGWSAKDFIRIFGKNYI